REEMANQVEDVMKTYRNGISVLAPAGQPLGVAQIELLWHEWEALTEQMGRAPRLARLAAYGGMIAALFLLGGAYVFFVDARALLSDARKLSRLLGFIVVTVCVCYWASRDQWRA